MLLIAAGTRGLVPMRALMNWTPIQAHATKHKTACLYVTRWGREGVVRQAMERSNWSGRICIVQLRTNDVDYKGNMRKTEVHLKHIKRLNT